MTLSPAFRELVEELGLRGERQMSELKPCPFCGGTKFIPNRIPPDSWTACQSCGAIGPTAENATEAIHAWNQRVVEKAEIVLNPPNPEPVYIAPRSFWDWLSDREWKWPKLRANLKAIHTATFIIAVVLAPIAIGLTYIHTPEWAFIDVAGAGGTQEQLSLLCFSQAIAIIAWLILWIIHVTE